MKKETEIRFKIDRKILKKIKSILLRWKKDHQKDTYYKGKFDGIIRLRKTNDKNEICYKCFNSDKKGGWSEINTEVADIGIAEAILKGMKLKKFLEIKKIRETAIIKHKGKKVEINIDYVGGLGLFCELEIISNSYDKNILVEIALKLGIDKKRIINKGYVQLMLNRQKEYGDKKPKDKTKDNRKV